MQLTLTLILQYILIGIAIYKAIIVDNNNNTTTTTTTQQHCNNNNNNNEDFNEDFKCLTNNDLYNLLIDKVQVLITMPAKASGTSIKEFAYICNNDLNKENYGDNFITNNTNLIPFLLKSIQTPSVLASHMYNDSIPLQDYIYYSSRKSIAIYMYRNELDRLSSAIYHVIKYRICNNDPEDDINYEPSLDTYQKYFDTKQCIINEEFLIMIIQNQIAEISFSIPKHLNCDFWDAVNENNPDLVFIHYTKASVLQTMISKRFCPNVIEEPIITNTKVDNNFDEETFHVRLSNNNNNDIILLDNWLNGKIHSLHYTLQFDKGSCKNKINIIEDTLLHYCTDQILYVSQLL